MAVLQALGLILAGLLAGEEFIVRYGVQPALLSLDDRAHIQARVALVRSLRVVVPVIMLPAVAVAVAVLVLVDGPGTAWRWAGVAALAAFLGFSFLGTVPINMKVAGWDPDAPPTDWRATVTRWQRLDVLRSSAAIVGFACFAAALAVQLG
ncbi:DUF1772 domain-containing protein [Dactylosporangium sp. NPDC000244]|uniref:DUF1772 domain-containing protein n=1 Tax=Dactylosporangium sp. NPDC000244 TaxID=3154365 RepID=UPI003325662C